MAAEVEIQLFKKLRYLNLSAYNNIRIDITVKDQGNQSHTFDSPVYDVSTANNEYDFDGGLSNVPHPFHITEIRALFNVSGGNSNNWIDFGMPPTAQVTQVENLEVLTGPAGKSSVAFDGGGNAVAGIWRD